MVKALSYFGLVAFPVTSVMIDSILTISNMRPGNHENRVTHLGISVFGESKRIGAKTVNINDYVKRVVARSRREWPAILGLVLAGMALVSIPVGVQAQVQQVTDKSRKLKSGNPPEYSGLAKELNLKGVARVMVTVAPD